MRNKTETGNRNTKEAKTVQPDNKRALGRGLEMLTQLSTFDLPQPHSVDGQNLRNTDSSPSDEVPIAENNPNTEATTIEVNIYNVCYTVKPPDNLTVNDIRELANYIDGLMRRVDRGQGTNDPLSRAILVTLNLAARMRRPKVNPEETINQLIAKLDQALS